MVFLTEDFQPVGYYGDRTLAKYRDMARKQLGGATCPTGLVADQDSAGRDGRRMVGAVRTLPMDAAVVPALTPTAWGLRETTPRARTRRDGIQKHE
ncbi:MAG: hypothetical protein QM811_18075 [Pirellulales bacterium]